MSKFVFISLFASILIIGAFAGGDPFAICDEPMNLGYPCASGQPQTLYYYDSVTGFCEVLNYRGCGGNGNQFSDQTYCETFCIVQGEARPSLSK